MSRLLRRLAEQSHTREKKLFSRSVLRSSKILLQNGAIECNAMRTSFRMVVSEKHAAQGHEKLRKRPSLNYKSAALDQLSYAGLPDTKAVLSELIKSVSLGARMKS